MKKLTAHYSILQFSYWAASTGATSFASAFMLGRGLSSGMVGILLASAGLFFCLIQPLLASAADKSKNFIVVKMMLFMSAVCTVCYGMMFSSGLPLWTVGILYTLGISCSDAMHPMLNAVSVAYNQAGYHVGYGPARAVGSAASAISTLALGFILAGMGTKWMLAFIIFFRICSILILLLYPRIKKPQSLSPKEDASCTAMQFFLRYKYYCVTLIGVLFLGMFHAMTENYMIAIMYPLGGDSSHVGTALFIGSIAGAPAIFFFDKIRRKFRDSSLLKIGALSFLIKSLLLFFAGCIKFIYLIQFIQITSYVFIVPTLVYFAGVRIRSRDMVKGQAFGTAFYALGCSAGNFTGGQLLDYGVEAMLLSGVIMCILGTVVIFASVNKSDI